MKKDLERIDEKTANLTIHKDSQGRAAGANAQFGVNVPIDQGINPCSPVMVAVMSRAMIKNIRIINYTDGEYNCEESNIIEPSWDDIERYIRRLDKEYWPSIWMYKSKEPFEDDVPDLEILGGSGHYVIAGKSLEDEDQRFFTNDLNGKDEIQVWLSDQGAIFPSNKICFDIDVVLEIAKFYFEKGQLPESHNWT